MKKLIAMLLAFTMVFSLCACGKLPGKSAKNNGVKFRSSYTQALLDEDGNAYLDRGEGDVLQIKGDIFSARLSPGGNRVAVLEMDGTLTVCPDSKDVSNRTVLTEDGDSLQVVMDDGVVYSDADDICYRYTFADDETYKMGDVDDFVTSDSFSLLYGQEGKVYFLRPGESDPEKIGTYDSTLTFDAGAVSEDGKSGMWTVKDDSKYTVYLYEGEETFKLGSMELSNSSSTVTTSFNVSGSVAVAYSLRSNVMFIKPRGEEPLTVKLGNDADSGPYSSACYLRWDNSDKFSGLYLLVESSNESSLYFVDTDGEREKVLSGIKDIEIANGYIFYTDKEDVLFCSRLNGDELDEPVKIASDVDYFDVPFCGGYVYYLRDYADNEGTLYVCKQGEDKPVKISSGVFSYSIGSFILSSLCFSTDGKTVYYLKDCEVNVGDTYNDVGTLYSFTFGDDGSVKIATDVVDGTLDSGLMPNYIDPKSISFERYTSSGAKYRQTDDAIYVNLVYYNGKDLTVIARDLVDN